MALKDKQIEPGSTTARRLRFSIGWNCDVTNQGGYSLKLLEAGDLTQVMWDDFRRTFAGNLWDAKIERAQPASDPSFAHLKKAGGRWTNS